jgi:hypothetical protein
MLHKTCFLFLLITLTVFAATVQTTTACICLRSPTILSEYEQSHTVVIARAMSVEKSERSLYGIASIKMTIEKVFKGNFRVGEEIIFAQAQSDCGWDFQEKDLGRQFLFYLDGRRNEANAWYAGGCSRSRRLEHAADDLLYLGNMDKMRGKTRLSGTLSYGQAPVLEGEEWISKPLSNRKVRLIGEKKTYELVTNPQGVYEIYDLPAGIYKVELDDINGWKIDHTDQSKRPKQGRTKDRLFQVVVETGKLAYLDITYGIENIIRGKVLDLSGNGIKSVRVRLIPTQGNAMSFLGTDTGRKGKFEIKDVPPGKYFLAINDDGKINSNEPIARFYYPNVFEREKAGVIVIGAGDVKENINIYDYKMPKPVAPAIKEFVTVEGKVSYKNGEAAIVEVVEFKTDIASAGVDDITYTYTDSKGRFSLKILKGSKGKLYSRMPAYVGRFENCPEYDELVRKTVDGRGEISTDAIDIRADENLSEIKLKYSVPYCGKPK